MTNKTIVYSTKFEDGTEITNYLAAAYAEGFCEGEQATEIDKLHAWSYLIGTSMYTKLQGWFYRAGQSLIESGIIDNDGKILKT